jgi:hypothetical protein
MCDALSYKQAAQTEGSLQEHHNAGHKAWHLQRRGRTYWQCICRAVLVPSCTQLEAFLRRVPSRVASETARQWHGTMADYSHIGVVVCRRCTVAVKQCRTSRGTPTSILLGGLIIGHLAMPLSLLFCKATTRPSRTALLSVHRGNGHWRTRTCCNVLCAHNATEPGSGGAAQASCAHNANKHGRGRAAQATCTCYP